MDGNRTGLTQIHNIVLTILSIASIGAIVESLTMGWEFWVPPLICVGLIACWVIHIIDFSDTSFRETYYFIYSMLVSFFYGVHETSFFDIAAVSSMLMVTIGLLARKGFLILLLAEYVALLVIQIVLIINKRGFVIESYEISRIVLHSFVVFCLYKIMSVLIKAKKEDEEALKVREEEREVDKIEMEDFLVNVSHELRTPVNVINGLSSIILKKEERNDVHAIMHASMRLSLQIEDIQDYSEIQRGDVFLEEDKYLITSLINDIIVGYNTHTNKNIELVVDLDPKVPNMMKGDARKISKIIRHLLSNSFKFTSEGGVYLKISAIEREYGVNLLIEVEDTGVGMSRKDIEMVSKGMYQSNKKRNRSTGGIGLGFPIIYGFTRKMNGFVSIDSVRGIGTSVRVSIPQEVVNLSPCLKLDDSKLINVVFHILPDKYKNPAVRDYYKRMALDIASRFRVNLYFATNVSEVKKLVASGDITHIFMGEVEYKTSRDYFEKVAVRDVAVIVSADRRFKVTKDSHVIVLPKPIYAYSLVKVLNGDLQSLDIASRAEEQKPKLDGIRALVVDDEPMNLVVATGLFKEYNMVIDTAKSGFEAIDKYKANDYDVVFMDHMMPGMDGVEAMKRIRDVSVEQFKTVKVVALTANAISGARDMFMKEGFDGFISKPINITDFERTMNQVFSGVTSGKGGGL